MSDEGICSYRSVVPHPAAKVAARKGRIPLDTVYYQCRKLRTFVSPTGVGDRYCGEKCKYYTTEKKQYARLNNRKASTKSPEALLQCINRGPMTNDTVPCETCTGKVELKLFKCQVHTTCTIAKQASDASIMSCSRCPDYNPNLPEENMGVAETIPAVLGRKLKWQYGVTTIRRRAETTLPQTLKSLITAGFERPHLFVDGDYDGMWWKTQFGLDVTCHYPKLRTFGNWVLALASLYILKPDADRYAVFQDDFVTYHNLREYLDRVPYPQNGYMNLYSFPENERLANGAIGFYPTQQTGQGAVALVFSQQAVRVLLSTEYMVNRPQDPSKGWRAVDGGIVSAMKSVGWREFVHNPSLVQHIGHVSSMGNGRHAQSKTFRGPDYDALKLLKT